MVTKVGDKVPDAKDLAPFELQDKGLCRFFIQVLFRGRQVWQVRHMVNNGPDICFIKRFTERGHVFFCQCPAGPPAGIPGKDLKRIASRLFSPYNRLCNRPGD